MYLKAESATIVEIQKKEFLSIRRMYITVQLDKDGSKFSFYWTHSPVIIILDGTYGNRASSLFLSFWLRKNLIGKKVLLYHAKDDTNAYLSYAD